VTRPPDDVLVSKSPPIGVQNNKIKSESIESFLAKEDVPITWLVDLLFPETAVSILAAQGGFGKSWMLSDLALEVSRGGKWLGHFQTKKGTVLYVDEESAPQLLRHRLKKLVHAKGVDVPGFDVQVCLGLGLNFSQEKSVKQFREILADVRPSLVVIDSLIRVHNADENSATDMSKVFRAIKSLYDEFECAFVICDHARKVQASGNTPDQSLRGTSDKFNFADTVLSGTAKSGNQRIIEHTKSRYAQAVPGFVVELEDVGIDGTEITYVGESADYTQQQNIKDATAFLDDALTDEWIARKELAPQAKEAGVKQKALADALHMFVENGLAERDDRKPESGRGRKAAYYRKTPPFNVS